MQKNPKIRPAKRLDSVIAIVGPTASGKTALAVALAEKINAEIISCDSRSVYQGAARLTAVPEGKKRGKIFYTREGIPYHLVDFLNPKRRWNASDYAQRARRIIRQAVNRGKRVIVAGGTGFYYRALFDGLSPLPPGSAKIRRELENILRRKGIPMLQRELRRLDPAAYRRMDIQNPRRLIRALELCRIFKGPASKQLKPKNGLKLPRRSFLLQWPQETLKHRIEQRARRDFDSMAKEVRRLAKKYPGSVPGKEALLAAPIEGYLRKELTKEQALEQCVRRDYGYAKRQITWFKKEPGLIPVEMNAGTDEKSAFRRALQFIESEIKHGQTN